VDGNELWGGFCLDSPMEVFFFLSLFFVFGGYAWVGGA